MQTIGAAEARTNFAAFLQQVSEQGERILIEQHGRPKAMLVPIDQGYAGPGRNPNNQPSGSPPGSNGEAPGRQAIRMAKLGYWIWDEVKDRCIYCSDGLAEMNGVTVEEYFERYAKLDGLLSEIHPEDRENYEQTLAAAKREAAAYEIEFREVRPDGELRYLRECAEPVLDSRGRHLRTVGTLQDITELRRAETALRESDQRFKDFADASSDWFWEMDEHCRFSYFSDRFTAFSGLPKEALLGKTREETGIPNLEPSAWRQHLSDLAARRSFRSFEHPRTLPDGREVSLSINGKAIFDEKGIFKGYRGTGSDITESKAAERALKSSQADLEKAQRLAKIGSWRWSVDRNALISCSAEYARLHGVSPDEAHDLLAEQMERVIHPDDRERVEAEFKRFDEEGRDYEIGYRIVRPDGEVRHVFEIGEAIFDGAGRVVEQVGTVQDVTDFKRIEEELRQAREDLERRVAERTAELQEKSAQLQAILDHSPALILLMDAEGRYLLANREYEKVFATTNEAIRGKLPAQIHDLERAALSTAEDSEVLRTRRPCTIEESIEIRGQTRTFLASKFPVLDAAQELIGIAAIATDITERKKAEEAAERDRELLASAVEALDEGFVIFDDQSRMVLCNGTYRDIFGPTSDAWVRGVTLEEIARATAEHCIGLTDKGEIESWVAWRVDQHKRQAGPFEQKLADGRWFRVNDSQLPNGWTVGTRANITDQKRAEKELRESEQRFRDYAEASSDWVWEMDADLRFTYMSENVERILGVKPEWHYGKTRQELLGASYDREAWADHLRALQARRPFRNFEYLRTGNGVKPVWLRASGIPVHGDDGTFLGYRGTGSDITVRRQTEQALTEREAQLGQAQKMAKIGVFIWDDLKGCPLHYSEEIASLLGLSMTDSMRIRASHEHILDLMIPEDRAPYGRVIGRAKESRSPYVVEYRTSDRSGTLHNWRETGEPVSDEEGNLVRTFGTLQDITAIRRTEDDLRESERRYRELFEESPVAMLEENWVALKAFVDGLAEEGVTDFAEFFREHPDQLGRAYDLPHRFGITQAAVELYRAQNREELQAAMTRQTADPDELSGFGEMIEAFYRGASKFEYEADEIACDDKPIITRIKAVIPPKYRDDWSRVLVTMEDITKRKRAEEQLHQAQRMEALGQLTGGVAHDFNNLLAIISGNAELLAGKSNLGDRRLQAVIRAAGRGGELTQRLLAFSRKQTLHPQAVEIGAMIGGMIELLGRTLDATIEIKTSSAARLWRALVDPGQLENALLNLAINARDAMAEGGVLAIKAFNAKVEEADSQDRSEVGPGDYVVLAVSDSGHGMSPEIREHALEPFFTTKQVGEGSGLGLAMVYGFVMQSGGHVSICSEEGQGTTVKLYLPRAKVQRTRAGAEKTLKPPRAKGESVLVVEDDDDVRELATEMLRDLGYRVQQAPDGPSALSILESAEAPDLLLSDVVLPRGLSGLDLAERVRRERPAIKILFMSGYSERSARRDSLARNGALFLNKPFRKRELAVKLREVLGR